ncbi:MAG: MFS transporter [Lachnospiraceae bacterium]|nr:MFS transporter [Lachnospiraceae bacterium]
MSKREKGSHSYITFVIGGCLLFALSLGIRMNYGILLNAYATHAGLPYDKISMVVAIGELVYGFTQPLFGMVAIKRSNGFVLKAGLLLLAFGFILSAFSRSAFLLILTLGILLSAGTGAVCFGIVMGAISPFIPKSKAAVVSGIVNASSGIGSSLMSPIMEQLITAIGLTRAMLVLSIPAILLLPVACKISRMNCSRASEITSAEGEKGNSFLGIFKKATQHRTYRYLMIGFATCGFHMSLIQNHLYSQIISYGIGKQCAAFAYTTFGIGTMTGAFLCGLVCSKISLKNVLGSLYLFRVVIIAVFIFLLPKNIGTIVAFAILLGLSGDATVTPTSEIISHKFGAINMAFLFGMVFVCHQIGAFVSTWMAGLLLNVTGSYGLIWMMDLLLCILASAVSYRIRISDYEIA